MQRIGKIIISEDIVNQSIENKVKGLSLPEIFSRLQFLPLKVEALPILNRYEYVGVSPVFDKIEPTQEIPEYSITVEEVFKDAKVFHVLVTKDSK